MSERRSPGAGFALPAMTTAAILLAACATERPLHTWPAQDLVRLGDHASAADGPAARAAQRLRLLVETYGSVVEAAGYLRPELVLAAGEAPNAYALAGEGKPMIAVNLPMLALVGDDPDALAALLGHELAHLYLRHQTHRQQRATEQDSMSGLAGFLLSAVGVPFGSMLADAVTVAVERGNTRDEERQADQLGVDFMRRAGFDPAGAVRLQQKLAAAGDPLLPFLATHPSAAERVENMRALTAPDAAE